ncbi:hypothetical protein IV203_021067 [Nitzschia inconspicua]|uniref:Uncharacterized protein n=1 Tax=Nitzschia inconspicua TaxID=303405 RepID=A0A9K3PCY2_9STRA|nr:hypothetical protein IV203_021067 [Nitzschia inconspicua]
MVTNLVEVVRIDSKSSSHVAMHFENSWLAKYPRPLNVIHDQGGEFIRKLSNVDCGPTPGGLAFCCDMILNIPLITDLQQLQKHRQQLIDQRLILTNTKRFSYDCAIGDEVLKLTYNPDKLQPRVTGPYKIT